MECVLKKYVRLVEQCCFVGREDLECVSLCNKQHEYSVLVMISCGWMQSTLVGCFLYQVKSRL